MAAHLDIGLTDSHKLPRLIDNGEVYTGDDDSHVLLLDQDRVLYKSALKVDTTRSNIHLTTLFPTFQG